MLTRVWAATVAPDVAAALGSPVRPGWTVTVVGHEPARACADLLNALDETALVKACLAGQREAFDIIVERHRR